jgi:dihydroneopterin aldolase
MTDIRRSDRPVLSSRPGARVERVSVFVRGFVIAAEIGVYPHERGRTQPLIIDMEVELSPQPVDSLADTVNYEYLTELARRTAAEGHIGLVETYVQLLAEGCLDIAGVQRVRVRVEKPEALEGAEAAGVEMILAR